MRRCLAPVVIPRKKCGGVIGRLNESERIVGIAD
jgi:hypothetical protein